MSLPAGTYDVRFLQNDIVVEEATITINESESPASFPVELRATDTHIQWRPESTNAWADLVPFTDLSAGGSDFEGVEMRVSNDFIQYRNIGTATWQNLLDISDLGSGSTTDVTVTGEEYTTEAHGISPSGNPVTDRTNLQAFIETLKTEKIFMGVIKEGVWKLDKPLTLYDGLRLRGEGMERTIIDCPTATWDHTGSGQFNAMRLEDDGTSNAYNGIFLYDFQVIGADKNATDNGALVSLRSCYDFEIKRVKVVDASSYGIFVAGYGVGSFTNDINSEFWNSAHRGVITQCVGIRGQIAIGLEGGAEGVLIMANHAYDTALHSFRVSSGYDCTLAYNTINGAQNAIWVDRHKGIKIIGNTVRGNTGNGMAIGGFNSSDGIKSLGVIIVDNQVHSGGGLGITDAYQGDDSKRTHNMTVHNNQFFSPGLSGGHIRFLWTRRLSVQGNTSDYPVIRTSHNCTGIVGNNMMELWEKAAGVIDMGNNIDPNTIPIT